jgi:GNAT superfamily N-acetyltransferase
MILRGATGRDALAIATLHADSWRSAYRGILSDDYLADKVHPERVVLWQSRFAANATKPMFVIVAESGQVLEGFVCVFPQEDPVFGSFLDNLHVAPSRTGQGIGKLLLAESVRHLLRMEKVGGLYLWVMEQNKRARQFYARAGAAEVETKVLPMPDGGRHPEVRCYWPDPARLLL